MKKLRMMEIILQLQQKKEVNTISISSFLISDLDDHNVGKYFAVFWPTPKVCHWGKLLKGGVKEKGYIFF